MIEVLHPSMNIYTHPTSIARPLSKRKRSTIKYRETEYAETSEAQIPTPRFEGSGNRDVDALSIVDHAVTNALSSRFGAQLNIFEDTEAVIKMIIQGQKSDDETRVQNPQSCVRLVV